MSSVPQLLGLLHSWPHASVHLQFQAPLPPTLLLAAFVLPQFFHCLSLPNHGHRLRGLAFSNVRRMLLGPDSLPCLLMLLP